MADRASFYYRTNSASSVNDIDIDPPRTRIAVACNRCRRRKIKCSGSVGGESCEACIRANNAECVFADRPMPIKTGSTTGFDALNASLDTPIQLQPSAPLRTSNASAAHHFPQASMRSSPSVSRLSMDDLKSTSPTRTSATTSPTFPMASPVSAGKRGSITSAHHPYQRPGSAGLRRPSADPVSTNLARYSQSLIQAQAMQLSGRQPQMTMQHSGRSSSSQSSRASLGLQHQQPSSASSATSCQLQPALATSPSYRFRQTEYTGVAQVIRTGGMPDMVSNGFSTPDSFSYSPVFPNSMYSAATPELISSDSVSTIDSRSVFSTNSADMMYTKQQPQQQQQQQQQQQMSMMTQPYKTHPTYINVDYSMQSTMPVNDPNQWTPGVDKIANQWLQFSPQQSEQFF